MEPKGFRKSISQQLQPCRENVCAKQMRRMEPRSHKLYGHILLGNGSHGAILLHCTWLGYCLAPSVAFFLTMSTTFETAGKHSMSKSYSSCIDDCRRFRKRSYNGCSRAESAPVPNNRVEWTPAVQSCRCFTWSGYCLALPITCCFFFWKRLQLSKQLSVR